MTSGLILPIKQQSEPNTKVALQAVKSETRMKMLPTGSAKVMSSKSSSKMGT